MEHRDPRAPLPPPPRRQVVDHALARRALLGRLRGLSTVTLEDVCDASPYLQRAAEHYGTPVARACPVCGRQAMSEVIWVHGEALGDLDGVARSSAQLARLAQQRPDFAVREVEVCRRCGWNHLVRSWRTGTPGTPRGRRSRSGALP